VDQVRLLVVPADPEVAGAEDFPQLVPDEIDDRLEVQLLRHPALDAVDHRELGGALLCLLQEALRLVEQPRVLQRDAHACRDRADQAHVAFAERVLALVILEHDRPQHAVAPDDGNEDSGLAGIRTRYDLDPLGSSLVTIAEHDRLARAHHARPRTPFARCGRRDLLPDTVLVLVQIVRKIVDGVVPANAHVAGLEHLAQLVADEVDDRLELELRRHALLDAVDDGELRRSLLLGPEQALRLVEEPRIVQCRAEGCGDRRQNARVRLAVRVLVFVVLDGDHAAHAIGADDGHGHHRLALFGALEQGHVAPAHGRDASEHARPPRACHSLEQSVGSRGHRRDVQPLAALVGIQVVQQAFLVVVPGDAEIQSPKHLAQLVPDQVDDCLEIELRGEALLDGVDQRELGRAPVEELAYGRLARGRRATCRRTLHARRRALIRLAGRGLDLRASHAHLGALRWNGNEGARQRRSARASNAARKPAASLQADALGPTEGPGS
jgi:hypothetical protein